jgi:hypothetical protein
MRMRTAGWRPHSERARPRGSSLWRGPRLVVLALVMVAAGMAAGSAPATSRASTTKTVRSSTATATGDAIWTVDPGGSFKASGPAQVADSKTDGAVRCASLMLGGKLQTELETGTGVGSITSVSATDCTIGTIAVKVAAQGVPWTLNAVGYDSSTGETTGSIAGIDLVVTGSGCSATLDGTATGADDGLTTFTYTNSTAKLTLGGTGNLHWWAVSGCSGLGSTSDPGQASGTLAVTPSQFIDQFCAPYRQGIDLNPHLPVTKPPPGAKQFATPSPGCAYVAGFTNAQKLNEAAFVGPAFADLVVGLQTYTEGGGTTYIQINNAGLLRYDGLAEFPPARATLLGFGFMPVSATLQLSETGTFNAIFVDKSAGHYGCPRGKKPCAVTTITTRLNLRLYDVTVNGVPLNVGPHCQTVAPLTATLSGIYPAYQITSGGPLTGSINIPSFTGCSNDGDNLDTIFTASVSGSGNETLLTQAFPCVPYESSGAITGCPPVKPVPKH